MNAKFIELRKFASLVARNAKCYFKDKFTFFMSLITPMILFVLFITFLRNVYIESFNSAFSASGLKMDERIINGCRSLAHVVDIERKRRNRRVLLQRYYDRR